jgi:DNA repair exonuclease SbcCD ATPase subunit
VSEPVAFRWLSVEAFRGFREKREFRLDASAVILSGPNGTGKTSFFDAIQWLLLGKLQRLETFKTRQTDEFVVNQYTLPGPAVVEAEVTLGGQLARLRRSGNARDTLLEWESEDGGVIRGSEAERLLGEALSPSATVTLESALLAAGLLQQDIMRSVLEAKASERFEVLNRFLGLDILEDFESAVRQWGKDAAEVLAGARREEAEARARREQNESRLAAIVAEVEARPSIEAARRQVTEAVIHHPIVSVQLPQQLIADAIEQRVAEARAARSLVRDFLAEDRKIQEDRNGLEPVTDDEIDAAEAALQEAAEALALRRRDLELARRAAVGAEQRSEQLTQLAALAIPLLAETCPVCEQDINPSQIAQSLQKRASDSGDLLALREAANRAETIVREAEEKHRQAETESSAVSTRRKQVTALAERDQTAATSLLAGLRRLTTVGLAVSETPQEERIALEDALPTLEALGQALERLLTTLQLAPAEDERRRLEGDLASLKELEATRRVRTEELALRQTEAKSLQDATVNSRVGVGSRRVEALRPLIADIYSRLDPHPSFTLLDVEHDVYRARGTMTAVAKDPTTGRSANPVLVFSSSQANIAALSYFLALGWAAGEAGLPFVLLDDPLQSMDDVNVLGFSDLCRFIRTDRQFVISTHERRFAGLLERKLAPRSADESTLLISFLGWDRSGPEVEIRAIEPQLAEIDARLAAA